MQRIERGKSRSDLAWQPAGLANQFLYVQRVFEELMGLMPRFPAGHACLACTLIVMHRGSAFEEYVTFGGMTDTPDGDACLQAGSKQ